MKNLTKLKLFLLFYSLTFSYLSIHSSETNIIVSEPESKAMADQALVVSRAYPMPKEIGGAKQLRQWLKSNGIVSAEDLCDISDPTLMAIFNAGKEFTLQNLISENIKTLDKKITELQTFTGKIEGISESTKESINNLRNEFTDFVGKISHSVGALEGKETYIRFILGKFTLIYLFQLRAVLKFAKELGEVRGLVSTYADRISAQDRRLDGLDTRHAGIDSRISGVDRRINAIDQIATLQANRIERLESSLLSVGYIKKLLKSQTVKDIATTIELMSYVGYPLMSFANSILFNKIPLINKVTGSFENNLSKLCLIFLMYRIYNLYRAIPDAINVVQLTTSECYY